MAYTPSIFGANGAVTSPLTVTMGATSQQISTAYQTFKPQEWVNLVERNSPVGITFATMLKARGLYRGVAAPTTGHYEAGHLQENLNVGAVAPFNPGDPATVTLTAGSVFTANGQSFSFPEIGHVGELIDGTPFQITAKPAVNQVVLTPRSSGGDLSSIAAGQKLFLQYRAKPEGGDIVKGYARRVIKYSNTFQYAGDSTESTGTNLNNELYWQPIPGSSGNEFMFNEGSLYYKNELAQEHILIFGKPADISVASTGLGFNVTDNGTQGLLDFMQDYAYQASVVPGFQSIQDFQNVTNAFTKEGVTSNEYDVWLGINAFQAYSNVFANFAAANFSSGAVLADGADGEIDIKFGCATIALDGFQFMLKNMPSFSNIRGGATPGYPYPDYACFVPMSVGAVNMLTGERLPSVFMEYKQGAGGVDRLDQLVIYDGTGKTGTNVNRKEDIITVEMRSEIALHCAAGNNFFLQTP
jgi:hypothetical protein